MHDQPTDKNSKPISEGDTMGIKTRTGEVTAEVQKVVLTMPEADREGVRNTPKVRYLPKFWKLPLRKYRLS